MSSTSNNQTIIATPARFTKEEKSVLYDLFQKNEDVIDIKYRRNSTKKTCSIRECWEKIMEEYNNHPDTTTGRNVKQIQKFWLNARLRKHYPISGSVDSGATSASSKSPSKHSRKQLKKFETINVIENNIKFEKECESEDIEMIQDDDDDDNNMHQEIEISSSNDGLLNESTESTTHQYNIDHISADKLTLNDLLEFKNSRSTRPGDEIVLQIKTPNVNDSITSASHHYQKDNNTIVGNNSTVQAYTTTSYRISNPVLSEQQYQTTPIVHHQPIIQQPQLHNKSTPGQQNCCSHNNNNNNTSTATNSTIASPTLDNNETINFYRMKEAELKYKEEQLKLEQTKIELAQAKEVLKHMKELHCYQIEEMKLKLRLLNAEEKKSLTTTVKGNGQVLTIKKLQH